MNKKKTKKKGGMYKCCNYGQNNKEIRPYSIKKKPFSSSGEFQNLSSPYPNSFGELLSNKIKRGNASYAKFKKYTKENMKISNDDAMKEALNFYKKKSNIHMRKRQQIAKKKKKKG